MHRYVVGFLFDKKKRKVLLIRKKRPEWQKGLLNGIGGKIENGESPLEAMYREGFEESGLKPTWAYKGLMKGINNDENQFECHIFYAYSDTIHNFIQNEDEEMSIYNADIILFLEKVMPNLKFLIPYGMQEDGSKFMTLRYGDIANENN